MTNFARNVYCILGLPFDFISMASTVELIRNAAETNTECFFSTPNLNFLIACRDDEKFRSSVLNSNLSLPDGMSVIFIATLLKLPLSNRIAGSDLYDKLREPTSNPLKVFFFGGQEGVAEQACAQQNHNKEGVVAVGFHTPGFGSVEEMSSQPILDKINAANADFILVSLGARKGQAWIEQNREKLNAPIISHLGAVVNFVAGNVKRAPRWVQIFNSEWLWRIYQEPNLWVRYFNDGADLIKLLFFKLIPYALWIRQNTAVLSNQPLVRLDSDIEDSVIVIKLHGACLESTIQPLRDLLIQLPEHIINYELDLQHVNVVDSAFIGLCLLLLGHVQSKGGQLRLTHLNESNKKIFFWSCTEFLLI
jgi:N-acetylglucosaminyldiphosphoundecaprenol N-acetyl-beta-D-mannosaminyltransferase